MILGVRSTRGMMVLDKRAENVIREMRKNVTIIDKLDTKILMDCIHRALSS